VINELELRFFKTVFSQLQQNQQVRKVLIVGKEKEKLDFIPLMTETFDKVVMCREHGSLSIQLQKLLQDITEQTENHDTFITYNGNEKALRDIRQELGIFAWGYSNVCK
jgi:hypothetical protein